MVIGVVVIDDWYEVRTEERIGESTNILTIHLTERVNVPTPVRFVAVFIDAHEKDAEYAIVESLTDTTTLVIAVHHTN